ncbi:MAG: hypothetical protein H6874_13390 [Hyphomicrobiaceae bacterium]|nr:hypothetical protein [Hyphomicrobiaceae bacterium]
MWRIPHLVVALFLVVAAGIGAADAANIMPCADSAHALAASTSQSAIVSHPVRSTRATTLVQHCHIGSPFAAAILGDGLDQSPYEHVGVPVRLPTCGPLAGLTHEPPLAPPRA